ncbi:lysozyme inhibitor LprI family protein [Cylindrospermopsis raciborskii]|nr:lysozyme inhibitor LprI family protein [Cylindrospermopsis raciborskii]
MTLLLGNSALLIGTGTSAIAQFSDCQKAVTQAQLNQCAAINAKTADQKLNDAYNKVLAIYKGKRQAKLLVAAEEAWIKYRDASCAFSRSRVEGGSIMPMVYLNCLERLTKERTQELEIYQKEGSF